MNYQYLILVFSILLLYYYLFKFKYDRLMKMIGIIISIGGIISTIGKILEDKFPLHESLISNILAIPIFTLILIMFVMLTIKAWKLRNNPKTKTLVNIGFGSLLFVVLGSVIVYILVQLGVYD